MPETYGSSAGLSRQGAVRAISPPEPPRDPACDRGHCGRSQCQSTPPRGEAPLPSRISTTASRLVCGIMDKAERSATHVQDAAVAKTFARLTIAREFRTPVRGYIQIPIGRKRSPSAPKIQFETLRRTPLACCCRNVKSALQSSIMDHPSCTGYRPGVAGHSRTRAGEASSSQ